MSLSKGALGPEAAIGASNALSSAIEDLREKYAKKDEAERKSAAAAEAAAAAAGPEPPAEEGSDSEWLDDPGKYQALGCNVPYVFSFRFRCCM
jgi:hypothetical protein